MPSPEIKQLKEAMELGAVRERERIIALLEGCHPVHKWIAEDGYASVADWGKEDYIALIKGEN